LLSLRGSFAALVSEKPITSPRFLMPILQRRHSKFVPSRSHLPRRVTCQACKPIPQSDRLTNAWNLARIVAFMNAILSPSQVHARRWRQTAETPSMPPCLRSDAYRETRRAEPCETPAFVLTSRQENRTCTRPATLRSRAPAWRRASCRAPAHKRHIAHRSCLMPTQSARRVSAPGTSRRTSPTCRPHWETRPVLQTPRPSML
jgi:hypothetical protein